jgi:cell division septum initiation protein DivIVA
MALFPFPLPLPSGFPVASFGIPAPMPDNAQTRSSGDRSVNDRQKAESAEGVDLGEVARLVEALERDLAKVQGSSEDIRRLRQEVEALKSVVHGAPHEHHRIPECASHGSRQ